MRLKNSALVFWFDSKHPRTQLVTVFAPTCCTPLITIQKWLLSMTTPTPSGSRASTKASTICCVRRSCTCNRRANTSAIRAIFDNPMTISYCFVNNYRVIDKSLLRLETCIHINEHISNAVFLSYSFRSGCIRHELPQWMATYDARTWNGYLYSSR